MSSAHPSNNITASLNQSQAYGDEDNITQRSRKYANMVALSWSSFGQITGPGNYYLVCAAWKRLGFNTVQRVIFA